MKLGINTRNILLILIVLLTNVGGVWGQINGKSDVCAGTTETYTVTSIGTSYTWSITGGTGSSTTNSISVAWGNAGLGSVSVSVDGGADESLNIIIYTVPTAPTLAKGSGSICSGTGNITLTATGGGGTGYQWMQGGTARPETSSTLTVTSSDVGTYTVYATNPGCTSPVSNSVTVDNIVLTAPTLAKGTGSICNGTGSITMTASGGGGTGYQWKQGATARPEIGSTLIATSASDAGTYTVYATKESCTSPVSSSVTVENIVLTAPTLTKGTGSICSGTGSITLTAAGGGGTGYQWKQGATTRPEVGSTLIATSASDAGSYTVYATKESCTSPVSSSVTVENIVLTAPSLTKGTGSICSGTGSITLTASGGGGTGYQWKQGATTRPEIGSTLIATSASDAGTYTVYATKESCTSPVSSSVTVDNIVLTAPSLAKGTGSICSGTGSITLTASGGGGTGYQWKQGTSTRPETGSTLIATSASDAGTYTVYATKESCISPVSSSVTVDNIILTAPSLTKGSGSICSGTGSITLMASGGGGTGYQWKQGATTRPETGPTLTATSASDAGSYTVYATKESCISTTSAAVTVDNIVLTAPTLTKGTGSICSGTGSITLTASGGGGTGYQWKQGATTRPEIGSTLIATSASDAGTYTVYATKESCTSPVSSSVTVDNIVLTAPSLTKGTGSICSGTGSITLTAAGGGGTGYQWKQGATTRPETGSTLIATSASDAGTYTVYATKESCISPVSSSVTVENFVLTAPTITPSGNQTICQTANVTLTANGTGAYRWYKNNVATGDVTQSLTLTRDKAGPYTVTVTENGCESAKSNIVVVSDITPSVPNISVTGGNTNICHGGNAILMNHSSETGFKWYKDETVVVGINSPSISLLREDAGSYTSTVTKSGCESLPSNSITVSDITPAVPTITTDPANGLICESGTATLTASGSGTYTWYKGSTSLSSTSNPLTIGYTGLGLYSVTTTQNGCTSAKSSTVEIKSGTPSAPTISMNPSSGTICGTGSVTLTASGSGTYTWSKDGIDVSSNITNTLVATQAGSYKVSITNSCTSSESAAVEVKVVTLQFSETTLPDGALNASYSHTVTATGATPISYSSNGTLPTGLSFNASTQTISGTPTEAGTFTFNIVASNLGCSLSQPYTLKITKATQTINGINATYGMTYGDPQFELPLNTSVGLSITYTSGDNKVATTSGNKITITGAGTTTITATQAGNANYNPATTVTTELTVTKVALTLTADNMVRMYKQSNPVWTFTATGLKNGDAKTVLSPQPKFACVDQENKPVDSNTPPGQYNIVLSDAGAANYIITYDNSGKLTINKTTQKITFTLNKNTITFGDDAPLITVSNTIGESSLPGLPVTFASSDPAIATVADGKITIEKAGTVIITASQAGDDNHDPATTVSQTITIKKATPDIQIDPFTSPKYGDGDVPIKVVEKKTGLEVTYKSENTNVAIIDGTHIKIKGAGTASITFTCAGNENYEPATKSQNFIVRKKELYITPIDRSRRINEQNPIFTASYNGFVYGETEETESVFTVKPEFITTATESSPPGTYPISMSNTPKAANYEIYYVRPGVLTVTTQPVLQATVSPISRTYGENIPTTFTIRYTGFESGDNASMIDVPPTVKCDAKNNSPAGQYEIKFDTQGSDDKYIIACTNSTLTINKAVLIVTADNKTRYVGMDNPPLTVSYSGFKYDDDETVLDDKPVVSTLADKNTPVGSKPIIVSGGEDDCYNFSHVYGTLTILAYDTEIGYGAPPFEIQATLSPSVLMSNITMSNPDILDLHLENGILTATIKKSGQTTITISMTTTITIPVTVKKATLVARADDYQRKQGAKNPDFTISYSGFVYDETISNIKSKDNSFIFPTVHCSASPSTSQGKESIIVSGGSATNYDFERQSGTLEIIAWEELPTAFTPNGDEYNNEFLLGYKIKIFNRLGILLYTGDNGWDGKYKGRLVEPGVYFYISTSPVGVTQRGTVEVIRTK